MDYNTIDFVRYLSTLSQYKVNGNVGNILKPQIRNLIGCSGTMPEKLQGSFSSTRSLYKRNVRRHKPPLPHKAA